MKLPRFSSPLINAIVFASIVAAACESNLGDRRSQLSPISDVPAYDLLLDESAFPPEWSAVPCEPQCARVEGPGQAGRSFGRVGTNSPGHVNQDVFYLESEEAASVMLQRAHASEIPRGINRLPSIEFLPPPQIVYRSPVADEQYLACGVDVVPACVAGLRYGRYFVEFYFALDGWLWIGFEAERTGLRITEVEPIIRAMDELAVEQFGMSPAVLEQTIALSLETPFPLAHTPPNTLNELIRALSDPDPRARTDAAYALESLNIDAKDAIPALIANLEYQGELHYKGIRLVDEIDVRFAAVHALGYIGPPARNAIPKVLEIARYDPSDLGDFESLITGERLVPLRQQAVRTLAQIGGSSVIPELVGVLDDRWGLVSAEAAEAIGQLSGNDFSTRIDTEPLYSEDGIPMSVLRAKEWWEIEGRYHEWRGP